MANKFPPYTFTKTYHHDVYPSISPTNPTNSAKGKVVLITGGGRGLGKTMAKSFAIAGAKAIILLGRTVSSLESAANEIEALGKGTVVKRFSVDIKKGEEVDAAVKSVAAEFGGIDVFVSNAADFFYGNIADCSIPDYWRSIEINALGTLNCVQALAKHGISASSSTPPTFISLNTIGAHGSVYPGMSSYAVGKIAALKMMEYLAVEMAGKLRVFSIHPGTIATDMAAKAGVPCFDTPELPAATCVWLAASKDAEFLQGRMVWANWDVDELVSRKEEIVAKDQLKMVLSGWADGI